MIFVIGFEFSQLIRMQYYPWQIVQMLAEIIVLDSRTQLIPFGKKKKTLQIPYLAPS